MEEALRSLEPTDPVGYVASFLDGSARRWLMALWEAEGRTPSWRKLKQKLQDAFQEKHEEERRRLMVVRARQAGSLEQYVTEFTSLCLSAPRMDDLTKALLFTEGLADEQVRREVRQQHPESLADAVRHAWTANDHAPQAATSIGSRVHQGPQRSMEEYELREMRRVPQHGSRISQAERMRLIKENRCFRCKQVGHIARECHGTKHPNSGRQ